MRIAPMFESTTLPLLVEPESNADASERALCDWLSSSGTFLRKALSQQGALFLRGFDVSSINSFEAACAAMGPDLKPYLGGDSVRHSVHGNTYTSTELPSDTEIHIHNELSYSGWWPSRIQFWCQLPAGHGGQTTIADARAMYAAIDWEVRARFETLGVNYIRCYHNEVGVGRSWQETFETDNQAPVEQFCDDHNMRCEWTAWGLRTETLGPGVLTHSQSGEKVWFNQADQFHAAFNTPWKNAVDAAQFDADSLPFHATYGDGSSIATDELEEVRRAGRQCEVLFDWHAGDVLVLDNLLTMHGRKPFEGERRVLVSMS